jgi:hypothetical protein
MQEGTKVRLHCYEFEGNLVALAVDTLRIDDGHFVNVQSVLVWAAGETRTQGPQVKWQGLYGSDQPIPLAWQHTKSDAQSLLSTHSFHPKMELAQPPVFSVIRMTDLW